MNPADQNERALKTHLELSSHEGEIVKIQGRFVRHNLFPQFAASNAFYLSGILLEGDDIPKLFIDDADLLARQSELDGKVVSFTGRYFEKWQTDADADPPQAGYAGSWVYELKDLVVLEAE